ncbi:type VII secretion protein EssA [Jeotgalibacillus sp. ET6]|uniref:type VII secretion protein EssA n=1 Tax=Jeotgalibacillus sp. ET6 TaxID=3037260 RepID=UPI002418AEC8|nr:type VII secretion protein EssA [Jeotgalibacillus sp. ET6]MDG5471924.1 type VII secretion protein EssA [Jeotgalibacillus sp. ET6]
MKRPKRIMFYSLLLFSLWTAAEPERASASMVQPNQYEEKEINVDTNYFHEQSMRQQRESLSEEVLELTFDGEKTTNFDELRAGLFLSPAKETNTIASRAREMELFSEQAGSSPRYVENAPEEGSGINFMIIILGGIIMGAILLMVVLLFRFTSSGAKSSA